MLKSTQDNVESVVGVNFVMRTGVPMLDGD